MMSDKMKNLIATVTVMSCSWTACRTGGPSNSSTESAARPGFGQATVLNCDEIAVAGRGHFRAEVKSATRDFDPSIQSVLVFDNLVSNTTPVATLDKCTGDVDSKNLSCTTNAVSRPGFAKTFVLEDNGLSTLTATYTSTADFGNSKEVSFNCR